MSAIDKTQAYQTSLGAEQICIDLFQRVAAMIVIAIAGRSGKHGIRYAMCTECCKHLLRIIVCNLINAGEIRGEILLCLFSQLYDPLRQA